MQCGGSLLDINSNLKLTSRSDNKLYSHDFPKKTFFGCFEVTGSESGDQRLACFGCLSPACCMSVDDARIVLRDCEGPTPKNLRLLGNNLYSLLIIILRNSKKYNFY